MKFGKLEIKLGVNEAIVGAIIGFTALSYFVEVPAVNDKLINQCIGALIAWGASNLANQKKEEKE